MLSMKPKPAYICILIILILITGCSGAASPKIISTDTQEPTATPEQPTVTPVPPTDTPLPPSVTPTAIPSNTPTIEVLPTATFTPVPPTPSADKAILLYFIQKDVSIPTPLKKNKDGKKTTSGSSGCEGNLAYVNTGMWRTGDVQVDIHTALNKLLGVHSQYYGALYNPLYTSTFTVINVSYKNGSGQVSIEMTGSYVKSGDRCDKGRVRDQIWQTIKQFPGIKSIYITVNGNLLGDVLATEG